MKKQDKTKHKTSRASSNKAGRSITSEEPEPNPDESREEINDAKIIYNALTRTSPDAVFIADLEGKILQASDKALDLFGYENLSDLRGVSFLNLVVPDQHEEAMNDFRESIKTGLTRGYECTMLRKDGSQFTGEASATLTMDVSGSPEYFIAIIRDITDRVKFESAVREQNAFLQQLIDSIPSPIFYKDKNLRYVGCNKAFEEFIGLSRDKIIGKTVYDVSPKDLADKYHEKDKELLNSPDVQVYEESVSNAGGTRHAVIFRKAAYRNAAGEIIGQIGIIHDVTKLRQAEKALTKERDAARKYLDLAGVLIVAIDQKGKIIQVNREACKVLGYNEEEITGKSWFKNFIPGRIRKEVKAVFSKIMAGELEGSEYFENYVLTKSGEERLIAWHNTYLTDEDGRIISTLSSGLDITEERKGHEKFRKAMLRQKALLDNIPDMAWLKDKDSRFIAVNEAFGKLFGYAPDDIAGKTDFDICPEELAERFRKDDKEVMKSGRRKQVEEPLADKDGNFSSFIETIKTPIYDDNGEIIGTTGISRDITERKKMEEALRESEDRYRTIFENTGTATVILEDDMTISLANKEFEKLSGCSREEVEGKRKWTEFVAKDDLERMKKLHRLRRDGPGIAPRNYEFRFIDIQGNVKDILLTIDLIPGTKKGVASLLDITERKKAEEALRESEDRYRTIFENTGTAMAILEDDMTVVLANRELEKLSGCSREEVEGKRKWTEFIAKDDLERMKKAHRLRRDGPGIAPRNYEFRFVDIQGNVKDILLTIDMIPGTKKSVASLLDITEIKKAEKALIESESRYRFLFENMLEGYSFCKIVLDENDKPVDFIYLEVNDAFEKLTGLKKEDVIGRKVTEVIPGIKDFEPNLFDIYGKVALTGENAKLEIFFEPLRIWLSISVYCPRKEYFVAVFDNITERKLAEEKLNRSYDTQRVINSLLRLSQEEVPLEDILGRALDLILSLPWLAFESRGGIFLVEDEPGVLVMKAQRNLNEFLLQKCAGVPFGRCLCGKAASSKKVVFSDCLDRNHEITYEGIVPHGHYCVPILFVGKTVGVLNIYVREGHIRDQSEEEFLLSVSDTLAGIIVRKRAEEALFESEQKHRTLFETMMQGVVYQDADGKIISANPAAEMILGLTLDQMQGRTSLDPGWKAVREDGTDFPGDEHPATMALRTGEPVMDVAMGVFNPSENQYRWILVSAVPLFKPGENKPYQVHTTFTDFTERKKDEERVIYLNSLLQAVRDVNQLIVIEKEPEKLLEETCKILIKTRGYRFIWIGEAREEGKRIFPIARAGYDERYLDSVVITWDDSPTSMGPGGRAIKTRKPCVVKDIASDPYFEPWKEEALKRGYASSIAVPIFVKEKVFGTLNVYSEKIDAFNENEDEVALLVELAGDIGLALRAAEMEVERKQAEEKIKIYQFMVESAHDAIFFKDLEGRYITANKKTLEAFGLSRDQVIGKNDYEIMPNREEARKNIEDDRLIFNAGKLSEITKHMTGADGKEYWFQAIKVPLFDDKGKIKGLVGIARDITERKLAEAALILSNVLLSTQQETSIDGILAVDAEAKILSFNQRFVDIWGIPEDLFKSGLDEPVLRWVVEKVSDPENFLTQVNYLYEHKEEKSRDEIGLRDGRTFDRYSAPMIGTEGNYYGRVWYFRDITDRKEAEKKLIEKIKKETALADISSHFIGCHHIDNCIDEALLKIGEVMGADRANIFLLRKDGGIEYLDNTHEWCASGVSPRIQDLKNIPVTGVPAWMALLKKEENLVISDASRLPDEARQEKEALDARDIKSLIAVPLYIEGEIAGCLGIEDTKKSHTWGKEDIWMLRTAADIVGAKFTNSLAEEALTLSEEKFRNLLDNMPDSVFTVDLRGNFTFVSPMTEKLTGYPIYKLLTMNILTLVAEEYHPLMREKMPESLRKDKSPIYEVEIKTAGGRRVWVQVLTSPAYDKWGRLAGIQGIARDITEKRQAELQVKASLKEKEVLLKEIHHRVKNNMQIISSLLNLQSTLVKDVKTLELFRESRDRIRSMALIHESLYKSKDLGKIDFGEYIRALIRNLFRSHGTDPADIVSEVNAENIFLGIDTAIPCGLIINELVSNSLKYAFPGNRKGRISIVLNNDKEKFILAIKDDGVGMPANIDYKKTDTLGLQLVKTLAEQLDGNIELIRERGTEFKIEFYKQDYYQAGIYREDDK
ncbi:MAG: PAS domain S-box protein [Chloroflexi bacterium]|nr:PAS domain S-box protein [Chloroflexota bacterium]